jgi:hypothetical protein
MTTHKTMTGPSVIRAGGECADARRDWIIRYLNDSFRQLPEQVEVLVCSAASAADNAVALEAADLGGRHAQQLRQHGFGVLAELRRAANGDARDG